VRKLAALDNRIEEAKRRLATLKQIERKIAD
jgi:hypothetical protein